MRRSYPLGEGRKRVKDKEPLKSREAERATCIGREPAVGRAGPEGWQTVPESRAGLHARAGDTTPRPPVQEKSDG